MKKFDSKKWIVESKFGKEPKYSNYAGSFGQLNEQTSSFGDSPEKYYGCSVCPEGAVNDFGDGQIDISGQNLCDPVIAFEVPPEDIQNNNNWSGDANLLTPGEYVPGTEEFYSTFGQGLLFLDSSDVMCSGSGTPPNPEISGYNCRPGHIGGTSMCVPCQGDGPCTYNSEQECISSGCEELSNDFYTLEPKDAFLSQKTKKDLTKRVQESHGNLRKVIKEKIKKKNKPIPKKSRGEFMDEIKNILNNPERLKEAINDSIKIYEQRINPNDELPSPQQLMQLVDKPNTSPEDDKMMVQLLYYYLL